jgi:hypothetical protein
MPPSVEPFVRWRASAGVALGEVELMNLLPAFVVPATEIFRQMGSAA